MKLALVALACSGCVVGWSTRVGVRPAWKTPKSEVAGRLEGGGMVRRGDQYYSFGPVLDVAGYPRYPAGKVSLGLNGRFELRRPTLDGNNERFGLWVVQLTAAAGSEIRDGDTGDEARPVSPLVTVLVGYGRGSHKFSNNTYASWTVGLEMSRASLDDHGGAWFIGISAGLRLGFLQDELRDEHGNQ